MESPATWGNLGVESIVIGNAIGVEPVESFVIGVESLVTWGNLGVESLVIGDVIGVEPLESLVIGVDSLVIGENLWAAIGDKTGVESLLELDGALLGCEADLDFDLETLSSGEGVRLGVVSRSGDESTKTFSYLSKASFFSFFLSVSKYIRLYLI